MPHSEMIPLPSDPHYFQWSIDQIHSSLTRSRGLSRLSLRGLLSCNNEDFVQFLREFRVPLEVEQQLTEEKLPVEHLSHSPKRKLHQPSRRRTPHSASNTGLGSILPTSDKEAIQDS